MNQSVYKKDAANKKMVVTREFSASLQNTWKAWTDKDLLEQWWAPKPWKAETKTMDFREGGHWFYCMAGPAGEKHWSIIDFKKIVPQKFFIAKDSFCDERGNKNDQLPGMDWTVEFFPAATGTNVQITIVFAAEKDMQTIIDMGFEQGFSMAHQNLDEVLARMQK
jgi:uncharacterized protein YndB with AHSA1/START domain